MKGLLLRLSMLDEDAGTALRVIAFFDALVERKASPRALVRATAGLAECGAGLRLPDGTLLRAAADGTELAAEDQPDSTPSGRADLGADGCVWLERAGGPGPLDTLLLERMALAARALVPRTRIRTRTSTGPNIADPGLVELVLSERETDQDRARALRLLGLRTDRPLRVIAVAATHRRDPGVEAVSVLSRGVPVPAARVTVIGRLAAVLLQQPSEAGSPADNLRAALADRDREQPDRRAPVHIGVGGSVESLDATASWEQAKLALRFATGRHADAVIDHDELGILALFAEIPTARLAASADVMALTAHAATDSGAEDIAVLDAYCRTGSLRQAAAILHLHHSSIASRLARVEDVIGWRLDDPEHRLRARLTLLAHHLTTTAEDESLR